MMTGRTVARAAAAGLLGLALTAAAWAGEAPAAEQGYINAWLFLGPFDNAGNQGMAKAWIDEASPAPALGKEAAGAKWRYFDDRLFSRNYDNYQDLFSFLCVKGPKKPAAFAAYLHAWVWSPTAQKVSFRAGANQYFASWLNGKPLVKGADPNGERDFFTAEAPLKEGWNSLLVKVGCADAGRFGFYARFCGADGREAPGLIYAVDGTENAAPAFTRTAPGEGALFPLPVGWRSWPYVQAHVNVDEPLFHEEGSPLLGFIKNPGLLAAADRYRLSVAGGAPPYRFSLGGGTLPPGLELTADGSIVGTVGEWIPCQAYAFEVWVTDAVGRMASRSFTLEVRDRPTHAYERRRLSALIHGPERVALESIPDFVELMRRQGYGTLMPITYNNGDIRFRYPNRFDAAQGNNELIPTYKKEIEARGMAFGMYMGNLNIGDPRLPDHQHVLMFDEVMRKFSPKALWFDWLGLDGVSLDALYSVIRAHDPECVIIINGTIGGLTRGSQGDWDVCNFEGLTAWGERTWEFWPIPVPWFKKNMPESWRLGVTDEWGDFNPQKVMTDWRDAWPAILALVGDGFIPNFDHTYRLGGDREDAPFDPEQHLVKMHRAIADWVDRPGQPSLAEAYTKIEPGVLPDLFWGYNTLAADGTAVYLILMKNPRGKTGIPRQDDTFTVGPLPGKAASVVCMNNNRTLAFEQRWTSTDKTVTVRTADLPDDPIAVIVKIALETPVVFEQPLPPAGEENLARGATAKLLARDGVTKAVPSANQVAAHGLDGDRATTAAAGGFWDWLYEIDLQRMAAVNRMTIHFSPSGFATHYKVYRSPDGRRWEQVAERRADKGESVDLELDGRPVRYLRIESLLPNGPDQPGGQMAIADVDIFAAPFDPAAAVVADEAGVNLALGAKAWLLSRDGAEEAIPSAGQVAANGVDGDPNTTAAAGGHWAWTYEVDLGGAARLKRVVIKFNPIGFATEYKLHRSANGRTWETVATRKAAKGENVTLNLDGKPTRFLRVEAVKPDGPDQPGSQMGIAELEAYE